jgi:hypothetical protein
MGWRGAGGSGAASTGWYYFAGGLLMILGGLGEVCFYQSSQWSSLTTDTVDPRKYLPLCCLLLFRCLLARFRRHPSAYLQRIWRVRRP